MINKQEEYINKIKEVSINPLKCSNHFFDEKQQAYHPGKRYNLSRYPLKDYLTVPSNFVVFELDAKTYSTNYKLATQIIEVLNNKNIKYYIFASGGKGLHIEVWLDKPEWTDESQRELFKEALSYNFSFRDIRLWFWNKILDEANIDNKHRGKGEIVDSSCLLFSDLNDKTKLLRVCGGRKIKVDPVTKEETINYKTYIIEEEFNKKKVVVDNFKNVKYPFSLEKNKLDAYEFSEFINEYVKKAKALKQTKEEFVDLSKNKGYTGLDSVQRILEGLPTGKRNAGAQVLAIAMANDKMPREQQETIMKEYVKNCSQIGDAFTIEEAVGWIEWMQHQEEIFWNCGLVEELGVHDQELCNYCKKKYKAGASLLTQTTLIQQVEELLGVTIKGENETKMLMFLLMLSKDFPSKTGNPGWNIPGDPMSQNIILSSESSSGKTWITKRILELFGEKNKDYFVVSRQTKNVLNYYTEINMDGKIIFIEEIQGLDENTAQLRVWMSEGELSLDTVEKVKDEEGNEVNTKVTRTTQGQPVFITNQAEGVVEDQLNNRSWVLSTDTSTSQTDLILDYQDELNSGTIIIYEEKLRALQDALRLLKPYHFLVPFANHKILNIPVEDVRSRRDYQKFMTLIKCSAYFHQKQRLIVEKDGREFIVCNLKDYEVAKKYSNSILGATFSGLTIQQIDIINTIRKSAWKEEFEISDLMRIAGKTQPYWYGQLNQLCDLGYIIANKQGAGKSTIYNLNEEKALNIISLPASNELVEFTKNSLKNIEKMGYQPITSELQIPLEQNENFFSVIIGCSDFIDDKSKKQPINKSRIEHKAFSNFSFRKKEPLKTPLFIGYSKEKIINFFEQQKEHILSINDFETEFPNQDELFKILDKLKSEGIIMEVKPNKYILL